LASVGQRRPARSPRLVLIAANKQAHLGSDPVKELPQGKQFTETRFSSIQQLRRPRQVVSDRQNCYLPSKKFVKTFFFIFAHFTQLPTPTFVFFDSPMLKRGAVKWSALGCSATSLPGT
jgi:hypothetical protein